MIHAIFCIPICIVLACISPLLVFLPAAFFIGREVSEAEYRWMAQTNTNRSQNGWFMAFHISAWDGKSIMDWVGPLAVSLSVFCFANLM